MAKKKTYEENLTEIDEIIEKLKRKTDVNLKRIKISTEE